MFVAKVGYFERSPLYCSPQRCDLAVLCWAEQAVTWLFRGEDSTGDWAGIEASSGFVWVTF